MTRCVITGGRGLAGTYLTDALRAAGDEAIPLDRSDGFDVTVRDGVRQRFAAIAPDVVFHLAAFTHVGDSWTDPVATWRVNTEGTLNVLDAARASGVQRVVVVGSAEEYGRVDDGVDRVAEVAPLRPVSPYGASKVAAEYLALQAFLGTGLDVVRVRPFNHTGAGQPPRFVIAALAHRIAAAERDERDEIPIGNLDAVRELLDVRDVVRAYVALARDGVAGDAYNVCLGVGHRIGDLADRMLAMAKRPVRLVVDPNLVRPLEVPRLVGDPAKLQSAIEWQPAHSVDDTLGAVLAAARAHV